MSEQKFKPGDQVDKDMVLYVKDEDGNTLSDIKVPAGHRVPPTRVKGAKYYSTKK